MDLNSLGKQNKTHLHSDHNIHRSKTIVFARKECLNVFQLNKKLEKKNKVKKESFAKESR